MQQHVRRSVYAFVGIVCFFSTFPRLPATAAQSPASASGSESTRAAARQIAALRQEWVQNLHGKQLDPSVALYNPDAVFYSPGSAPATGLPAIKTLFATVMKTYDSDIQLNSTGLSVSGDLAVDSGGYDETLTLRATKVSSVIHGSYLMVLQRGKDQHWRISQQMWTLNPPKP